METDIAEISKRVNELAGIKESDTGLAPPALWDLAADKQSMQSEQPLQVPYTIFHFFLQCFAFGSGGSVIYLASWIRILTIYQRFEEI